MLLSEIAASSPMPRPFVTEDQQVNGDDGNHPERSQPKSLVPTGPASAIEAQAEIQGEDQDRERD
jgi:hypothetical protein